MDITRRFTSLELELDYIKEHLDVKHSLSMIRDYECNVLRIDNYLEQDGDFFADRYNEEVIGEAMKALVDQLNSVDYVEFVVPEKERVLGIYQTVDSEDGVALRKTTRPLFFLGDKGPGILTTYEMFVRTTPKLQANS